MQTFHKDHLPALDALRGIAVLLVLWVHLPPGALGPAVDAVRGRLLPGNVGVDLFFVLSGFLITRILLVDRGAGVPLRYFLARRFLRIFPIYYLVIALLAPRLTAEEAIACAGYVANYAFLFKSSVSILEHTWSLAVEEHFYLLWPPVVAFLAPRTARRVLLLGVLPLAVLSGVGALFVKPLVADPEFFEGFVGRTSTVRFFSLGVGSLLAFHEDRLRRSAGLAAALIVALVAASWALSGSGLAALGLDEVLGRIPGEGGLRSNYRRALLSYAMPCASAAAVLAAIAWRARSGEGARSREGARPLAPLRWVGRISYGLYLYHFPIFFLNPWGPGLSERGLDGPVPARVVAVLALCFGAAWASYVAIERPLLRYGARFRGGHRPAPEGERSAASVAARSGAAVVVVILLGWLLNGGAVTTVEWAVR